VRDGNKRIVQLKEGDPKGRHVVIVDDLVQSGGTLIECQVSLSAISCACFCHCLKLELYEEACSELTYPFGCTLQKLLATMGACKVSAYVTHGVFPKKSWERFNHDNGGMELAIVHIFFLVMTMSWCRSALLQEVTC
jgi:phosphoribosylpyrophosphate synthetase